MNASTVMWLILLSIAVATVAGIDVALIMHLAHVTSGLFDTILNGGAS